MGRPRKNPTGIMIATDTGVWISPEGKHYDFWKDVTRVYADHPLAKAMKDSFKPLDVHYDIEQMTAGPGEKRGAKTETRVA